MQGQSTYLCKVKVQLFVMSKYIRLQCLNIFVCNVYVYTSVMFTYIYVFYVYVCVLDVYNGIWLIFIYSWDISTSNVFVLVVWGVLKCDNPEIAFISSSYDDLKYWPQITSNSYHTSTAAALLSSMQLIQGFFFFNLYLGFTSNELVVFITCHYGHVYL